MKKLIVFLVMLRLFAFQEVFAQVVEVYPTSDTVNCNGRARLPYGNYFSDIVWKDQSGNTLLTAVDSLENLCEGTYTVTFMDSSETRTETFKIGYRNCDNFKTTLSAIEVANGNCNGSLTATISGGVAPYSFQWNDGNSTDLQRSSLCTGYYYIQAWDSKGCYSIDSHQLKDSTIVPCDSITIYGSVQKVTKAGNCDGSIHVAAYGQGAPYTYTWSNGFVGEHPTNLCMGSYEVLVKDNKGCSKSAYFTVGDSSAPDCSTFYTNFEWVKYPTKDTCNGEISIYAAGGSGNFSFTWSTGQSSSFISNLCKGNYTVTVSDGKGCTRSSSIFLYDTTFNENCSSFKINLTQIVHPSGPGLCDGVITAQVPNSTEKVDYYWHTGDTSNTLTQLCKGVYYLQASNSQCVDSVEVVLTESTNDPCAGFKIAFSQISSPTDGQCNGIIAVKSTFGDSLTTYYWSNGFTGNYKNDLCKGTYTIFGSSSEGCMDSISVTLNDTLNNPCLNFNATATITPSSTYSACDGSIQLNFNATVNPMNIKWDNGRNGALIAGLCPNYYTFYALSNEGCSTTQRIYVGVDSTVANTTLSAKVKTTPSTFFGCKATVDVFVNGGTAPYQINHSNGKKGEHLDDVCLGYYFVTVTDAAGAQLILDYLIVDSSQVIKDETHADSTIGEESTTKAIKICDFSLNDVIGGEVTNYVYLSEDSVFVEWLVYTATDSAVISATYAVNYLSPGYYTVVLSVYCPDKTDGSYLKVTKNLFLNSSLLTTKEKSSVANLNVYPNPFTDKLIVETAANVYNQWELYNLNGALMQSGEMKKEQTNTTIEMNDLSTGVYILRLSGAASTTLKVVKN